MKWSWNNCKQISYLDTMQWQSACKKKLYILVFILQKAGLHLLIITFCKTGAENSKALWSYWIKFLTLTLWSMFCIFWMTQGLIVLYNFSIYTVYPLWKYSKCYQKCVNFLLFCQEYQIFFVWISFWTLIAYLFT